MTLSFSRTGALAAMALIFGLVGCTVGPNYHQPSAPTTPEFKSVAGWQPAQPADQQIRGHWWEAYGDSELNSLEEKVSVSTSR